MNISDTINIILSVLSFVLALISVVTVIITLRQNGKMIKNNEDQIAEMRNEHRMSLQPVLYFSNPKYCLERPRLFIHRLRTNTQFVQDAIFLLMLKIFLPQWQLILTAMLMLL